MIVNKTFKKIDNPLQIVEIETKDGHQTKTKIGANTSGRLFITNFSDHDRHDSTGYFQVNVFTRDEFKEFISLCQQILNDNPEIK